MGRVIEVEFLSLGVEGLPVVEVHPDGRRAAGEPTVQKRRSVRGSAHGEADHCPPQRRLTPWVDTESHERESIGIWQVESVLITPPPAEECKRLRSSIP